MANLTVNRFPENPLIKPSDVKPSVDGWEVLCAFNAAVIERGDEALMLMRVAERPVNPTPDKTVLVPVLDVEKEPYKLKVHEFSTSEEGIWLGDPRVVCFPDRFFLTSISHLRLARSKDGKNFTIDEKPSLVPDQAHESFGLEDPRITQIGDTFYCVYKGVCPDGITQCLATTKDFVTWEKRGIIFCPENMDAMIFPEKVRGKYVALHRPNPKMIGSPNMWVAYSDDLLHWGDHKFMMGCSAGTWEGGRIGGGAVPFLTDQGWLEIYHAATPDDHYCLGAVLLDKDYPERVIAKTNEPILKPDAPYEANGFKNNVVFTCGALVHGNDLTVYYGAADECMCAADFKVDEILASLTPVG